MSETFRPATEAQLADAVKAARAARRPLEIVGHASKRGLGRPAREAATLDTLDILDMGAFSGISLYEPEELILSVGAATPLAEINAALAAKGQMLAFEPWDPAPMHGLAPGRGTIGGVFMTALAGPRRVSAGSARDHLLGFRAVNGMGELFKSGGRVVKNVTGFDLSKLMAGSFGTLGAATELTFKVLPRPSKVRTVVVFGLKPDRAGQVMRQALASPHEVSAAAHLPASSAGLSEVDRLRNGPGAATLIRLEGPGPSVEFRARALYQQFAAGATVETLQTENSVRLWREVRDQLVLPGGGERQVWRISVAPTEGPQIAAILASQLHGDATLDWGGGLVWLSIPSRPDGAHETVRLALAGTDGHATLVRAAAEVRARVGVFQPAGALVSALAQRVKQAFDPDNILNPGRMD